MKLQNCLHHQKVHRFLHTLCAPLGVSGIILLDGRSLHLENCGLVDLGTLPFCAESAHKYLRLKAGDVALLNDPSTGGSCLSEPTLVTPIYLGPGQPEALLTTRFSVAPILDPQLNEKNLRIPPTPIVVGGQLNEAILAAISQHPDCATDFVPRFHMAYAKLQSAARLASAAFPALGIDLSRNHLKNYFADSKIVMSRALAELPSGETQVQMNLATGERVKLVLEMSEDHVICDFAGTENSSRFHLTNSATFGVCLGTLLALLHQEIPINSGSFQVLEVRTPLGSFLNAKPNVSTFLGVFSAAPQVAQFIVNAVAKLNPRLRRSEAALGPSFLQFQFASQKPMFDWALGGSAATPNMPGEDMFSPWHKGTQLSIEQLERNFPIQLQTCALRAGPAGTGKSKGGTGIVKSYRLLAPAKLTWWLECGKARPEGVDGAKDGSMSEIYVTGKDGTKQELEPFGSMDVATDDVVTLATATAGGFGQVEEI